MGSRASAACGTSVRGIAFPSRVGYDPHRPRIDDAAAFDAEIAPVIKLVDTTIFNALIDAIREDVRRETGIDLQAEVKIVGLATAARSDSEGS